jgi:tetratricopeptide (TPR) repeat protein
MRVQRLALLSDRDADLRAELEKLLTGSDSFRNFLSSPKADVGERPLLGTLSPSDLISDRYQVLGFLGAGGMGEVYKVYDRELKEFVALKTLRTESAAHPASVSRLLKEVQLARRIIHPNICRMLEIGRDNRALGLLVFITMELLEGQTLAETLSAGAMTPSQAEPIARQLIAGLDAAHQQGILHRDFKSANVILAGSRAVITDFGLATERGVRDTFSEFRTGAIIGTPAYMPPEQLEGKAVTTAADIHALGAVLFEMVTGRLPFPGETPLAIALKRLQEDAPSPRDLSPLVSAPWENAILSCLEKDPARRPASALDVLALLEGRSKRPLHFPTRRLVAAMLTTGAVVGLYTRFRPKDLNPEAERSFKKAEEFARRRTADDLKNAVDEYGRALALEPDFAPAWAGLANAYSALSEFGLIKATEGNRKALEAAQRAIALDSRLARAHGVLGYVISNDLRKWRTAEPHFKRAVSYDSRDPLVRLWYASYLGKSGDSKGALEQIRLGMNEDPSNFVLNQQLAQELYRARRYDECYRQALELERLQPYEGGTHFMMARALERQERYADALVRCGDAVKYGLNPRLVDTMRSVIEWSRGAAASARDLALAAENYWRDRPMATIHVATTYGHMRADAKAIEVLLVGCDRDDASVLGAVHHPLLNLSGNPRYNEFLSRIGLATGGKAKD